MASSAASKMFSKAQNDRVAWQASTSSVPSDINIPQNEDGTDLAEGSDTLWASLDCLELLEQWVEPKPGNAAETSVPMLSPAQVNVSKGNTEAHAEKWLDNYVDDWNQTQWNRFTSFGVNLAGLHASLEALNLLLDSGTELKTLGASCLQGTVGELQKMFDAVFQTSSVTSQDFGLILGLLSICSKLALRMQEHGVHDEVERTTDFCVARADEMIRFREQTGSTTLTCDQQSTLFTIQSNASSVYIKIGKKHEAQLTIENALRLMNDKHEDADIFLLNQASLLVAQDAKAAAEKAMQRAVTLSQEGLAAEQLILEGMRGELNILMRELSETRLRLSGALPDMGAVFYVDYQQGDVQFKQEAIFLLEKDVAGKEEKVRDQEKKVLFRELKLMRCYRKLGNFYKNVSNKCNIELVSKYANLLLEVMQGSFEATPVHDAVGNASFLSDFYFLSGRAQSKPEKRLEFFAKVHQVCFPVMTKIQNQFGENHCFERAAEVFEKGAIASMLLKSGPDEVLNLSARAVRIRRIHNPAPSFTLARSMTLLSEAFAYAGEFPKAMEVAKQGERICASLYGELHYKTRFMRKIQGEHKKMFMKIFLQHHIKQRPSNLIVQKIESKTWMDDWIY